MERELWLALYALAMHFGKPWGSWRYSTADIVVTYFWAVIHDRPTSWAADPENWTADLRPALLPPQSTLSRRLRRPDTVDLMMSVEEHLLALLAVRRYWVTAIDGKPLAISPISEDPDAGFGPGAGRQQKGYKFHAVWSAGPMPLAWALAPMNVSEKTIGRLLIESLPGSGYLLGDTNYDVNHLYDLAADSGYQLVTSKTPHRGRGGLGHRRQSPSRLRCIELMKKPFGRALYRQRRRIEASFGSLTCFGGGLGPLPAWTRRFHRVRSWVHAKLLIAGTRWLVRQQPNSLAFA